MPEMKYTIIRTVDVDDIFMPKEHGAINGGMLERTTELKSPIITINVANMDQVIRDVEKAGGKIVVQKRNISNMGIAAYFQDTEGNVLGLWQELEKH